MPGPGFIRKPLLFIRKRGTVNIFCSPPAYFAIKDTVFGINKKKALLQRNSFGFKL